MSLQKRGNNKDYIGLLAMWTQLFDLKLFSYYVIQIYNMKKHIIIHGKLYKIFMFAFVEIFISTVKNLNYINILVHLLYTYYFSVCIHNK